MISDDLGYQAALELYGGDIVDTRRLEFLKVTEWCKENEVYAHFIGICRDRELWFIRDPSHKIMFMLMWGCG